MRLERFFDGHQAAVRFGEALGRSGVVGIAGRGVGLETLGQRGREERRDFVGLGFHRGADRLDGVGEGLFASGGSFALICDRDFDHFDPLQERGEIQRHARRIPRPRRA